MARRFTLLVNRTAGRGRARRSLEEARATLVAAGAQHDVLEPAGLTEARDEATRAAAAGSTVVAVGGDGLVGALAGVLRDSDGTLGILPAGRGNDFARALGLPLRARDAARVLVDGVERRVDVAEAGGHAFVGILSAGFDADVNELANEMRLVRGNLVYSVAAVRAVAAWEHATFQLVVDGEPYEHRGFAVGVGNSSHYGGGMRVIPHAQLDDGRLDVFLSGVDSKLRLLRDLPRRFKAKHVGNPTVGFLEGSTIAVDADRPMHAWADGERVGALPLTVTVRERCLSVLVPPP